ncbi:hypothetical protein N0V83_000058 [Neocucurbitaria cava]|uniref:Uncharacterized protein n=1 Tax=Neocucurbitaria cava TaxID=798079 RepID=A0A9W8YIN2_9PLEO|nr:hypothetical protein N0V83_000058 [Neocucurbitaria cava]
MDSQPQTERGDSVTILDDEQLSESLRSYSDHATRRTAAPSPSSAFPPRPDSVLNNTISNDNNTKSRNLLARVWYHIRAFLRPSRKAVWEKNTEVSIVMSNNKEITRLAHVLFDPQCLGDLISTSFLRNFPGLQYERSEQRFGRTILSSPVPSIGTVDIRWHHEKAKNSTSRSKYSQTRIDNTTCHVVDSKEFDLIIGRPTIDRLELFIANRRLVAPFFRGPNTGIDPKTIEQTEQTAELVRGQAEQEQRRREEERKEKEQRERATR